MSYKYVVTTLFESHYEYGVGAFINSLADAEFEGLIAVGYKGNLPFWVNQLSKLESDVFRVTDKICLQFDKLDVNMHLGYYKSSYIIQMRNQYPDAEGYFYFDPDIIVIAKWCFFEEWIQSGVALSQDICYDLVYWNHPWRNKWRKDFSQFDEGINSDLNYYVNSGFIGCNALSFLVIERWALFTDVYIKQGHPIHFFDQSNPVKPYKGDQDILNAVLTLSKNIPLALMGKESMGFNYPITMMIHAVEGSGVKPWNRNYIRTALLGRKMSFVDDFFLNYCSFPVKLYTSSYIKRKKNALKISKIINRLWKK